jgi:hypothetical protein
VPGSISGRIALLRVENQLERKQIISRTVSTRLWHGNCSIDAKGEVKLILVEEGSMRSDLIFGAVNHIPNRFLLVRALAKASRALHRPGTRIQDTANDVLARFTRANPIAPHDAVPIAAGAPSRDKTSLPSKAADLKRAKVSTIRDARQPVTEAFEAQEARKRA